MKELNEPIKKYKKIYTGFNFNLKYRDLIKITFNNDTDLSNILFTDGEFEINNENQKLFKFDNLNNMYTGQYKTNGFVKWIRDVIIPNDAKVIVRTNKYKDYTIEYFSTTKIKLFNKREFWKEYDLIKLLVMKNKRNFISYIKHYSDRDVPVLKIILNFEGLFLKYLDFKYQTAEIVLIAVESKGEAIQYVSPLLINQELCNLAVKKNPNSLRFISFQFQNLEMCLESVKKNNKLIEYANPIYSEELKDIKEIKPVINKYLYTPSLHIKNMLTEISNNNTNPITNIVPSEIILYIKSELEKEFIPTIKNIKQILIKSEYRKYLFNIPEIINKLGYHIPIITKTQKNEIIKYFNENEDKFIICKKPLKYCNFQSVINYIIDKLNLDIELRFLVDKN